MRLIDADALIADCQLAQKQADRHGIEFANAFYSGGGDISTEWWCVEDMIENAPTVDAVEVVRCKDCRYWDPDGEHTYGYCMAMKHGYFSRNWEISIRRKYRDDWYCADGERRTDE